MTEPQAVRHGDVILKLTDADGDAFIRGQVHLTFTVAIPRGALAVAADLDGLLAPVLEGLQRMHDVAAETYERQLPRELCDCLSIVRDDDDRLQCLTHGDVTDRRAEPKVRHYDHSKAWVNNID